MKIIAHVLPFPAIGGTEHATLRIAKEIDSAKFTSVAFYLAAADRVSALFATAGFETVPYCAAVPSYRHAVSYVRSSLTLAREFKRARVDLVHCADLLGAYNAALAGRMAGIPVVCHVRNRHDHISARDRSFLWPIRHFVFVSQHTRDHFGHRVPRDRTSVIYDGIDVAPSEDGASVRMELGIPADAPLIGMVARVAPQKDYLTLAKAAVRILAAVPNARFLVAGDNSTGPNLTHYLEIKEVLRAMNIADAFIFTGERSDIIRIINALDIFVLSTHSEGLPLVILEAMAQTKPVVATNVDGVPEIVRHRNTGLMFEHQDDAVLASHVLELLRDPRTASALAEAGRALVQTSFTRQKFGANLNQLYTNLLTGDDRGGADIR